MRKPKITYYLIRRERLDEEPVSVVLDMLRYDGSRIESNAPPGYYLFSSDAPRAPHRDRWRSFCIEVGPAFDSSSEAWEFYHREQRQLTQAK